MTMPTERLSKDLVEDLRRNSDGRLSTRQWLALITEPLATLLLLSVPIILLFGRYGVGGRLIALLLLGGFALTILLRAIRYARVTLHYGVLYAESPRSRWRIWRKTRYSDKYGAEFRFDRRLSRLTKTKPDGAARVFFFESGGRRVLVSMIPDGHPKADLAEPSDEFLRRGGSTLAD